MKKIPTYTETCGNAKYDWKKVLSKPAKTITFVEMQEMYEKATRWATCPVAHLSDFIPREEGKPLDTTLRELGSAITDKIVAYHKKMFHEMNFEAAEEFRLEALELYNKIVEQGKVVIEEKIQSFIGELASFGYKVTK